VVQKGEVYRYHPGIQRNFISRWLELTSHGIKYYENEYKAEFCKNSPSIALVSVPIEAITCAIPLKSDTFEI
jgi:hypothetical protein